MSQPLTIVERNELADLIRKYRNPNNPVECVCEDDHDGEGPLTLDECPHFADACTLAKALEALTRGI